MDKNTFYNRYIKVQSANYGLDTLSYSLEGNIFRASFKLDGEPYNIHLTVDLKNPIFQLLQDSDFGATLYEGVGFGNAVENLLMNS